MGGTSKPEPVSGLLRRTIAQAIGGGETNYLTLERETGVTRASIRRFVNGERTLRLDVVDKLAGFFRLELRMKEKR
jgi:plasmid maintenance system antidote protein VapI